MYFFLFIFGLIIGSFLNVVSIRFSPGQKLFDSKIIGGRSHCLSCRKQLNWYELIPVLSFVFLRGRCSSCKKRISWQYPVVEILSGLIFVFVPYTLMANGYSLAASVIWVIIFELFLLLSVIDFRHYIIPDSINVSLAILGIILVVSKFYVLCSKFQVPSSFLGYYSNLLTFTNSIWVNHLLGLVFGLFIFGLIIFVSKGRGMGWGDFKLAGALGLILGWPNVLISFMLSFLIGGLVGIILIIFKKKKMKEAIPFGPFLVLGATLLFFFGFQILNGYFRLFL